jgi:Pseudouridylate synthases, 23S RNA-specific
VPVHRLDKETSGVLLVAASYEALAKAQEALRAGELAKEYVVWVQGAWPCEETQLLRHFLRKDSAQGYEKVRIAAPGEPNSREALCLVRPLRVAQSQSLLLVRLLTGRTHQIRVQLAAMLFNMFQQPQGITQRVPYSDFLSQVDNGQLLSVTIQGHTLTGRTSDGKTVQSYAPQDLGLVNRLIEKKVEVKAEPPEEQPWYMALRAC